MDEFINEIGFSPFFYINRYGFIDCHYKLYNELKIIDKEHWIYKFGLKYNELEAHGELELFDEYIKNALLIIPKNRFKRIEYRKLFLDLIYNNLDNAEPIFEKRIISGILLDDEGKPFPGQNVMIVGTNIGTETNYNGVFCLIIPKNIDVYLYVSCCYSPIMKKVETDENKIEIKTKWNEKKQNKVSGEWKKDERYLTKVLKEFYSEKDYQREIINGCR